MVSKLSVSELRANLLKLIDRIKRRQNRLIITKRGRPVAVMLSIEDYESLMETLNVLADPKAMAGIRAGERDIERRRTRSWEDIQRSLRRPLAREALRRLHDANDPIITPSELRRRLSFEK